MTTRLCIAALVTSLWAGAAAATDLYVSPSGSGTACTPGSPCALTTANAAARPGDVVRMADGTYTAEPVPSTAAATQASPILYIGNIADRGAVVVPSITDYHKPGVSWRSITVNGTVRWSDASGFDGIPNQWLKMDVCAIRGSLHIRNVSYSRVDSCTIDTLTSGAQNIIRIQPGDFENGVNVYEKFMDADTLSNNTIKLTSGMNSLPGDNTTQWVFYLRDCVSAYGTGCPTPDGGSVITNCVFERNVVDIYCPLGSSMEAAWRPWYISTGAGSEFRNNRWTIRYYTSNTGGTAWRLRDKTHNVTWNTDTLVVIGNNGVIQMSSQSGGSVQSDQHNNTWKDCVFDNRSTSSPYPPFDFQWGMFDATLLRNTFKTQVSTGGEVLSVGDLEGTANVIDHNTFVSFDTTCAPLTIKPANWGATTSLTVTNNIAYLPATTSGGSNQTAAIYDLYASRPLILNNNLYAYYGKTSAPGDRAVRFRYNCGVGCTSYQYSSVGPNGSIGQLTGNDLASVYGSPRFADSLRASFNPAITAGSAAIGAGVNGTDIGAVAFAGPDVTPPAAVGGFTTSMVSDHDATLTWTAPGDDGLAGVASAYEMRVSSSPMDDLSFASGAAVAGLPAPGPSGTAQGVTVTSLSAGTAYYYGIRARDEAGNWSPIRYLTVTTAMTDVVQPAKVNDLNGGP